MKQTTLKNLAAVLLATSCMVLPYYAVAQVTPNNANTTVYNAPNGVPIVDIAKANAAGLSHNKYNNYNVDNRGLVLNNGNTSQLSRASQLAGQVPANLNLGAEAAVILNEVVMPNRSNLAGYTEVVGRAADVIVANPYGITCNGCGFINTPSVTLTTGVPQINAGGALAGFRTEDGDILIAGDGLDASKSDYLGLLARSIAINGQINAKELDVVTGGSDVDYLTKAVTTRAAAAGAVPAFAIDSSALGGMYANRIRLIATENGVGVRMRGEAAASAGDFTLDASGKIALTGKVSADKNVKISTTDSGADAISATNAKISARENAELSALAGEIHLEGGTLTAGGDLSLLSDALRDDKSTDPAADNNKRYAGGTLTLTQTGVASLNGTIYGAGDDLSGTFDTLTVGADGVTIYSGAALSLATDGALALGKAALKADDGLTLVSANGGVTTAAGAGQGIQSVNGAVSITAASGLTNAGIITADNGDVTFRVNGTINNSGSVHAEDVLDIADKTNASTATLINSGALIGENMFAIKGASLNNTGTFQGGTGASTLGLTGALTNGAAGIINLASSAAGGGTITAASISNAGKLQSLGSMALNVATSLNNAAGGKIVSDGTLTIRGLSGANYTVSTADIIQSTGGALDIKGNGGGNAVTISTTGAAGGFLGETVAMNAGAITLQNNTGITSEGNLTINAASLNLGGSGAFVTAANGNGSTGTGTGTIVLSSVFNNPGKIYSRDNLTLTAPVINNGGTGLIAAKNTLNLTASAGDIFNSNVLFAGQALNANAAGNFTNDTFGIVQGSNDITITAGNTFLNKNDVNATRNLTIDAFSVRNEIATGDTRRWSYEGTAFAPNAPGNRGAANEVDHSAAVEPPAPAKNWIASSSSNDPIDDFGDVTTRWHATFYVYQLYGITPTTADKAQLLAGNKLTIRNFQNGLNLGSTISAPIVEFTTNRFGAQFTNDDYGLRTDFWEANWNHYEDCNVIRTSCSFTSYRSYNKFVARSEYDAFGAGIQAGSLIGGGSFGLTNLGGVVSGSVTQRTGVAGAGTTSGNAATFGGATITLPTNPNGFFIPSQNPNSGYLIETNPLFADARFVGSDYLAKRFGVDVDNMQRRLGDSNYEAYLIRQQLISEIGSNVIELGGDEAAQMQKLMDNGADQGKTLGLTYGKAPSETQLAGLQQDMVWMVETEVNGQKVLAPVVYLSAATKSMFTKGAVIAANNVNLNIDGVNNQGGVIEGRDTLNVTTRQDIRNTSGTIKGGDVDLKSTEGSIINETFAAHGGTAEDSATVIGKKAGIEATGNLSLDAKKDIVNKGADVKAGGDASLTAGDSIVFDTVEDKKSNTERSNTSGIFGFGSSSSETTESSTTQIKSGLAVGGNLKTKSGKDTTFAGTDVNVGGDADIDAGGNLNILSREDERSISTSSKSGNALSGSSKTNTEKTTTNVGSTFNVGGNLKTKSAGDTTIQGSDITVKGDGDMSAGGNFKVLDGKNTKTTTSAETKTGLGVGGGVYGAEIETDKHFESKSVGSNLNFGGNAKLSSDKTMTIQGSNVETGGDLDLKAKDVNIVEGRDIDERTHSKSTTTLLSIGSGDDDEAPEAEEEEEAEKHDIDVSAEAEAETSASGKGDLSLMKTTTKTTEEKSSKAKGSNIKSGGNMSIKAENDATIRGSNVEAGGDVDLNAKNVNIEAAQDTHSKKTTKSETSIGLHASSDNEAHAGAKASAYADDGDASASAKGSASGAGAGVNAGDAKAGAAASAEAGASSKNTVDFVRHTETTTTDTDITHTGSTIKSGGKMNVKADEKLTVKGSDLEAGGDVDLKAKDMSFEAVNDSHTTATTTSKTKAGLYAETGANAEANASADAAAKGGVSGKMGASADADAGVGFYGTNTTSSKTEGSTTAKTSTIKSGGNMNREADNKITDEGTQIEAGGDFTQKSKEWESKAAKDTTFSSSSSESHTGKLGLYGEANAGASASGEASIGKPTTETDSGAGASAGVKASYEYGSENENSASSKAVTSTIKSGGKIKTTTEGKTSLEGTSLESGGDMEVNAGSLDYKAAKDTSSSSKSKTTGNGEIKVGVDATKAVTGSLAGGYSDKNESESSSTAVVGSMKSGGKLKVETKEDARFEGTNIESADDAKIKAGGGVKFDAARDEKTKSSDSMNVDASISASKSKGGGKGSKGMGLEAEGGFEKSKSSSSDAVTGSIKSGGKLDIEAGKDATFEGTALESKGDTNVDAGGDVNFNAAKSTASEETYGAKAELKMSKGGKDKDGKAKGSDMGFEAEGKYETSDETTSKAGSIKSGGNLKVKSGNDVTLEGTDVEAGGKAKIDAKGNVNMKAAEDKKESLKVEAGLSLSSKKAAKGGDTKDDGKEAGLSATIEGGKSNTKKAGSIKAGEIDITSGKNATFEGTNLESKGDTKVKAGGDVSFNAAESSHIDGSFSGSIGSGGSGTLKDAGIGGGVERKGSAIKTGGNLSVESGGKTTLEGTKADVEGKADLKAQGGIEKKSAVSGGGQIGTSRIGAEVDVQKTKINAKGGVNE